jgi:hypothetical protein
MAENEGKDGKLTRANAEVKAIIIQGRCEEKDAMYVAEEDDKKELEKLAATLISNKGKTEKAKVTKEMIQGELKTKNWIARNTMLGFLTGPQIKETRNMSAYQLWTWISNYGRNANFEVVDQKVGVLRKLNRDDFKSMEEYLDAARAMFHDISNLDQAMMPESQFLRLILSNCKSKAVASTSVKNEVSDLYRKLADPNYAEDTDWDKISDRLMAAEIQDVGETNTLSQRRQGGTKTGTDEETNDTALLIIKTVKRELAKERKSDRKDRALTIKDLGRRPDVKDKAECFQFRDNHSCSWGSKCHFSHNGNKPTDQDKPREDQRGRKNGDRRGDGKRQKRGRRERDDEASEDELHEQAYIASNKRRRDWPDEYGLVTTTRESAPAQKSGLRIFVLCILLPLLALIVGHITVNSTGLIGPVNSIASMALAVTANKIYDIVPTGLGSADGGPTTATNLGSTSPSPIDKALHTMQQIVYTSDSGATTHVVTGTGILEKMTNRLQVNETIGGVNNNSSAKITHRGDLEYMVRDNEGQLTPVTIKNVAYVPDSQHRLFSNTQYLDDFYDANGTEATIVYDRHECNITLPGGKSFTGKRQGNLYDLPFQPCNYSEVALSSNTSTLTPSKSPPKRSLRTRRRRHREARVEDRNDKTAAADDSSK